MERAARKGAVARVAELCQGGGGVSPALARKNPRTGGRIRGRGQDQGLQAGTDEALLPRGAGWQTIESIP